MKIETRYIAFDGAIFYNENECKNYEEVHAFSGLDKIIFYDIEYNVKNRADGETLQDFINNVWAIKVNTAAEAKRVWSLLENYENYEIDPAITSNPLLSKTDELIEDTLIFDGNSWTTLPNYLDSTFEMLQKLGCTPIRLASYYVDYRKEYSEC